VSMTIETGISAIKSLASADLYYAGTHCINWDGRNKWGEYSGAGTYNYTVLAINSNGSDSESSTVVVQYQNNEGPEILNSYLVPHPYDPDIHGNVNIYFNVDRKAKITIKIKKLNGTHLKTVMDQVWYENGEHYKKWNGEDKNGNQLPEGVYILYVKANNGFGSDVYETQIYIGKGAFANPNLLCGGFYDVPANSKYCQAIIAAKSAGVFEGYADGTFKPYQPINRAEAIKVILKALSKPILPPDGGNLGFWDVNATHWYMPYLRTAKMYGVIAGYSDGSFKPGNTINRAELLKVFLEATGVFIPLCQGQPYPDIPNSNPWYLKYACFAKQYNLVSTDGWGQLNPATPMTRGDVADLFYRFEQQGLFSGAYYN